MTSESSPYDSLPTSTMISPSSLEHSSSSSDSDSRFRPDILDRTDELLKQYLNCLDTYQSAQAKFSERLSSVFLSLARANYASSPRQRYGSDYYDLGMKANLRITVNFEADNQSFKISKRDSSNLIEDLCSYEVRETVGATDHLLSLSTPLPKHSQLDPPTFTDNVEKSRNRREGDPLHWFGILVPSSLRDAQATSRLGIEEALPEMARMAIEMRRLESEIERLRKLTVKPK